MKPSDIRSTLISVGENLPDATAQEILALGPEATEDLLEIFLDEELREGPDAPSAPIHAAELLGQLTPPEALPALLNEYLEGDAFTLVCDAAALAIPKYREGALEALLKAYDDEFDPEQLARLCLLFSELEVQDERIYERLVQSFPYDIDMGAGSFGAYNDARALPLLQRTLDAWEPGAEGMPPSPFELGHAIIDLGGKLTLAQELKIDRARMERQHAAELQRRGQLIAPEKAAALGKAFAKATTRPLWNVRGFIAALVSGPTPGDPGDRTPALLERSVENAKSAIDILATVADLSDRLTKLHILTADAMAQTPSLVCPPADDEQGCADFCEGYIDAALRDHEWLLADRG
ncbi:MAG: hypothetical protein OEZ06_32905, partial [Myxococcales bacterium]|nr:hypothetical protein [Myxococcales bacterium]